MVIGVCGYGYSGSGAVVDLLQEYEHVSYLDSFECSFLHNVDGLCDLEKNLNPNDSWSASDIAIRRFLNFCKNAKKYNKRTNKKFYQLSRQFIDDITICKWKGFSIWDLTRIGFFPSILWASCFLFSRYFFRCTGKYIGIYPNRDMYYTFAQDDFLEKEKKYVHNVLIALGCDFSKTVVLDQVFRSNCPRKYFKYFDDVKAIVVDRDPRDIYAIAKKQQISEARFMPCDSVEQFINYYLGIRSQDENSDDILHVQFEDVVLKYDETVCKIEEFTGLKINNKKRKYFDPDVSKKNIKLYEKYPDIRDDISMIEKELSVFLYNQ